MKTEYIKPAVNFVIRPAEDLCALTFGESTFQTTEDDKKIPIIEGNPEDDPDVVTAKKYWAWDDEEDIIETGDDSSLF